MKMAATFQIMRSFMSRGGLLLAGSQAGNVMRSRSVPLVRTYAAKAEGGKGGSNAGIWAAILAVGAGGGYYFWTTKSGGCGIPCMKVDYQKVYDAIAAILDDSEYDDGSYGPVFVRLCWHASGTYDKDKKDGGSMKATMRFDPEARHGANAGLTIARNKLEAIKKKFPGISYGDLWTLAGVCAIQEMDGPIIPWRPGRVDGKETDTTPDGRLPDGANATAQHERDIFYRQGFNDQEITALVGAHALGRCHPDRSGFDGPWTFSPTTFSNDFYKLLMEEKWVKKDWKGPHQFVDSKTKTLMMLPSDMSFLNDKEFKKWVEKYAKDKNLFYADFSKVFKKLIENGVEFKEGTKEYSFVPTSKRG